MSFNSNMKNYLNIINENSQAKMQISEYGVVEARGTGSQLARSKEAAIKGKEGLIDQHAKVRGTNPDEYKAHQARMSKALELVKKVQKVHRTIQAGNPNARGHLRLLSSPIDDATYNALIRTIESLRK